MTLAVEPEPQTGSFIHQAFLYRSRDEFVTGSVAFVRAGLDADEPVLVAVSSDEIVSLRTALGVAAERVEFLAMELAGRNPGRIISIWHDFVDRHRGRSLRGIGQPVWPGRSGDELIECQQHEHLLNHAFAGVEGFWLLCPYDASALAEPVLDETRRAHPSVHDQLDGRRSTTADGFRPVPKSTLLRGDLAPAPGDASTTILAPSRLRAVRIALTEQASAAGLPRRRVADLVLVAGELAANSLLHAAGGVLTSWTDRDRVVVEVRDGGRIEDPLVGRRRPEPSEPTGRGLWLAHELSDLLQVRSDDAGTTVRASFHRR